jgi:hypothetical protein
MTVDLDAAVTFVALNGRLLERHRLNLLLGTGPAEQQSQAVLAALESHRNPDAGYGWALEPDLRSSTSQPVGAMHALEVFAETGGGVRALELLGWLAAHTNPDGGVAFALPFTDTAGSAPHWVQADPSASSLQMTTQLAAQALRLARRSPDVDAHPWLAGATAYCLDAIERIEGTPHAYEVMFALAFLDAVADRAPQAGELAAGLAKYLNGDGPTEVAGGAEGEVLFPLDFSPHPGTASRAAFSDAAIEADLARLAGRQQDDGGWTVDYAAFSPAAALEWRGYRTVQVIGILRDNAGS